MISVQNFDQNEQINIITNHDAEKRIVLDIIADGETVFSGLLNLLREIHLGHGNPPERGYHVSATDPGTAQWRFEPPQELPHSTVGGAPAHQPAAPSTGGATSSGDVGIAQLGEGPNNYNPWKESSPTGATSSAAGALAYRTVGGPPGVQPAQPSTGDATSNGAVGFPQLGEGPNKYQG